MLAIATNQPGSLFSMAPDAHVLSWEEKGQYCKPLSKFEKKVIFYFAITKDQ